jgi:long-subunit fatty acid transport protein
MTMEGAGARAMGMGGAFIAIADDGTAATFNPAGLAQLLKPEVSFVGQGLQRRVRYDEFNTSGQGLNLAVSDSVIGHTHLDPLLLSAMLPLEVAGRNLAVQLSAQRAFTLGEGDSRTVQSTPTGASGRASTMDQGIWQSGQIDLYSLSLAYECSQRILLGLTYNIWRGRWDLETSSSETSGGTTRSIRYRQGNRLDGQNYTLGLLWRWPTWSLGLVYQTAFRAEYAFSSQVDTTLPVSVPKAYQEPSVSLHWPKSMGIGWAYRPTESWLIGADAQRTTWSQARFMGGPARLDGVNFFDLQKDSSGQDATSLRLGAERIWVTARGAIVPLRLGLCREPQPLVDPVTGDQRIMYGLTLGSGFKRGAFTLDVAYRYAWAHRRASQFLKLREILAGSRVTSVGTERVEEQRLVLTLIRQFDREPVREALHRLFVGN